MIAIIVMLEFAIIIVLIMITATNDSNYSDARICYNNSFDNDTNYSDARICYNNSFDNDNSDK